MINLIDQCDLRNDFIADKQKKIISLDDTLNKPFRLICLLFF